MSPEFENQGHLVAQLSPAWIPGWLYRQGKAYGAPGAEVSKQAAMRAFVAQNAQQRIGEAVHGGSIDSLGIADGLRKR